MVELFRLARKQNDTVRLAQHGGKPIFSVEDEESPTEQLGQYQVRSVVNGSFGYAAGWILTLFHFADEECYKIWMPQVRERDNLMMPVPQVGSYLDRAGIMWTIYARGKAYEFITYDKKF
jgi:hypothetical protein